MTPRYLTQHLYDPWSVERQQRAIDADADAELARLHPPPAQQPQQPPQPQQPQQPSPPQPSPTSRPNAGLNAAMSLRDGSVGGAPSPKLPGTAQSQSYQAQQPPDTTQSTSSGTGAARPPPQMLGFGAAAKVDRVVTCPIIRIWSLNN